MNHNDLDQRLDQAIDALNTEASPAPYEQGDPEMFSLVDTARLAKSLREPAEPDADFSALAVARISADLRQTAPTANGIPPAATPAIGAQPETTPNYANPRGPIPFIRRYAELAAIIVVLLLVGGGVLIYQSLGPDNDGSPAVGDSSDNQPGVVATPDESGRCVAFNLVDAQAMSAFPFVLPTELPNGMQLDAILLEHWAAVEPTAECEGADYVTAEFQVTIEAERHSPIRFVQTIFEPQFSGDEAQEVEVEGKEVTRYRSISADDSPTFHVWKHDAISYVLIVPPQSPIAESDLQRMIESIPLPETSSQPSDDVPKVTADETTIERFRELQSEANFDLVMPTYLAGMQLANDSPYLTGAPFTPGVIATWVDNTSTAPRRFGLNQRPGPLGAGRDQSNDETETIVIHGVETTLYAYAAPYEGGDDAYYLQVQWELNGVNYMLSAVNVDRDTFVEIAESITPLNELEDAVFATPEPDVGPPAIEDPVEFVLAYQRALEDRDMDTVRGMLVERFREFNDDLLFRGAYQPVQSGIDLDPANWVVEYNEHFTVVRLTGLPLISVVLRRGEDNEWLVDRGPVSYWYMQRAANNDSDNFEFVGVEIERFSDQDSSEAQQFVGLSIDLVEFQGDDTVDVSVEWRVVDSQFGSFPLEGLYWVSGDHTGSVEVIWSNARVTRQAIAFPVTGIYSATFTLLDLPVTDDIELHIPDMTFIDDDGSEMTLSAVFHFPNAEYPPMRE